MSGSEAKMCWSEGFLIKDTIPPGAEAGYRNARHHDVFCLDGFDLGNEGYSFR